MKPQEFADSLLADAKKRTAEIEREARDEVRRLEAETEALVKEKTDLLSAQVRAEEERERRRKEARAKLEHSLAQLQCRKDLLDGAFEEASARLAALSGAERKRLLDALWSDASAQLDIGDIEAAEKDAPALRERGNVVGTISSIGGFVAHSKDKALSVDMRFETLLGTLRERNAREVAQVLFG